MPGDSTTKQITSKYVAMCYFGNVFLSCTGPASLLTSPQVLPLPFTFPMDAPPLGCPTTQCFQTSRTHNAGAKTFIQNVVTM